MPGSGLALLLRVEVRDWVIECCLPPPAVGQEVAWGLQLHEGAGGSAQELRATATTLPAWPGLACGRTPVRLEVEGAVLYTERPAPVDGDVLVTGTIRVAQHGEAPEDLPPVRGRVRRLRLAHVLHEQVPPGVWQVVQPYDVRYEDVQEAPRWFPAQDRSTSPARLTPLVLVDLEVF